MSSTHHHHAASPSTLTSSANRAAPLHSSTTPARRRYMRGTSARSLLACAARMALYESPAGAASASSNSKLIFAPAGHEAHGQAAQFTRGSLRRGDLDPSSPAAQFHAWFADAQAEAAIAQPEACTLSTASLPDGRVSSRVVYLKELDARGAFVIYSNFGTSRKAADLASNPHAALVFYWPPLQRQVRVEGVASRCSRGESQPYFDTRVRGSRIGAWASRQSQVLEPSAGDDDGRAQLEGWVAEAEERFAGTDDIPVPDFWGGLRIEPTMVEFWQGRESRLHDRFVYERVVEGEDGGAEERWTIKRLSP